MPNRHWENHVNKDEAKYLDSFLKHFARNTAIITNIATEAVAERDPKEIVTVSLHDFLAFSNGSKIAIPSDKKAKDEKKEEYGLILPAIGPIRNNGLELPFTSPPFFLPTPTSWASRCLPA